MATAAQQDKRFAEQVRSAPFIFNGQIVKTAATTISTLAPNERLAIVRVETVFRSPAVLGSLEGKRVTIQLAGTKSMKAGMKALFYATSWLYGNGIAVVEVARAEVPKDKKSMLAKVAQEELRLEDDKLVLRLSNADLVIMGTVTKTRPAEQERRGAASEHDPSWWQADIAVDRTEKGKARGTVVAIYFPASLDEYWLDVPKLTPHQRGVFIVHRQLEGKRARFQAPGPALMDPLDYQPVAHLERVRTLLKLVSR